MANPLDEYYLSKNVSDGDVKSPCVRNCCLDDFDVCLGCRRTLKEILAWGKASEYEKTQILNRIHQQVVRQ